MNSTVTPGTWQDGVTGGLPLVLTTILLLAGYSLLASGQKHPEKYNQFSLKPQITYWISRIFPTGGHLLGVWSDAVEHVHRIISSSHNPIYRTSILGHGVLFVSPQSDGDFARHSKSMKLSLFAATVLGKNLLGITDKTLAMMEQLDMTPRYHTEFLEPERGKIVIEDAIKTLESRWNSFTTNQCQLGAWLFDLAAGIAAQSLCGPDSPWLTTEGFMADFRTFETNFEGLFQPFPRLTANRAYLARRALLHKFEDFRRKRGQETPQAIQHRLNIIGSVDPAWYNNPDYDKVELLVGLAIFSTAGNLSIWLIRHILADDMVLQRVRAEVEQLLSVENNVLAIDVSLIGESCPWLIASWHEVLRLHMTGISRQAVKDFELPGGQSVARGDVIVLPMSESNRDSVVWPAPEEFLPQRFIGPDGKLLSNLTRKVKEYGVAGNLCPGRHYAKFIVTAIASCFFLTLDLRTESDLKKMNASKGVSAGFERCRADVEVLLMKKKEFDGKRLRLNSSSTQKFFRTW